MFETLSGDARGTPVASTPLLAGNRVPGKCPFCGCQTRDPFRGEIVIHDVSRCATKRGFERENCSNANTSDTCGEPSEDIHKVSGIVGETLEEKI